jgi:hypothetical protein
MMKKIVILIYFACSLNLSAQMRSFNEIFPNIGQDIRSAAFKDSGYYRINQKVNGIAILGSGQNSAIDPQIINRVLNQSPGYLVESVLVIPLRQGTVNLINVYNALGNIRGLNEMPGTGNQALPVFRNATRIAGEKQTKAIPDPDPANILPWTETFFIKLKDMNLGNTYFRAEMTLFQNGLRYTMSNFRNISFLFIPVIRRENFIAQLYIEPITEGVLMYSIAGADIPDFLTSKININSAITKRLSVFILWAAGGIVNGNR